MDLLLCGLAGFLFSQIVKGFFKKPLPPWVKLWLAVGASLGAAAVLWPHRPAYLILYGVAGAGAALLAHRTARFLSLAGDLCIRTIFYLRTRR